MVFCEELLLFTPISTAYFSQNSEDFIICSKNFTDADVINVLLTEQNNSKDHL
jgi:hypothetical protein